MWGHDLRELFQRGGFVMWPLLVFSIVATAVAIERFIVVWWRDASYSRFASRLGKLLEAGRIGEARDFLRNQRSGLARVSETFLDHLGSSAKMRDESVAREASEQISILETRINWLAVIGHLSPILGLLGTVAGLIDAFHEIELLGGKVQPSDLAAGIWKALLTTLFGLAIALPVLAVYQYLDRRVGNVALKMQWICARMHEWLHKEPSQEASVTPLPPADEGDDEHDELASAAQESISASH